MIRLVLAELNRLRSRRITWVAAVLLILALAALQFGVYQSVKPLSQGEIAEAKTQYEQAKKEYEREYAQNKAELEAGEQRCLDEGNPPEICSGEPTVDQFQGRSPIPFAEIAPFVVTASIYFVGFALALVAASFIGAEFTTGAVANWLTYFPNRNKVLTAKLLAVLGVSLVVGALALAATVGAATAMTRLAGAATTGVDTVAAHGARGVVMVAIFALLGFALALVTRHTIGAVGTLVGYLVVSSVVSIAVEFSSSLRWLKPLLPQNQVRAFLERGYSFPPAGSFNEESMEKVVLQRISFADSVLYWSVFLAAALVLSFVVFRRRDVT